MTESVNNVPTRITKWQDYLNLNPKAENSAIIKNIFDKFAGDDGILQQNEAEMFVLSNGSISIMKNGKTVFATTDKGSLYQLEDDGGYTLTKDNVEAKYNTKKELEYKKITRDGRQFILSNTNKKLGIIEKDGSFRIGFKLGDDFNETLTKLGLDVNDPEILSMMKTANPDVEQSLQQVVIPKSVLENYEMEIHSNSIKLVPKKEKTISDEQEMVFHEAQVIETEEDYKQALELYGDKAKGKMNKEKTIASEGIVVHDSKIKYSKLMQELYEKMDSETFKKDITFKKNVQEIFRLESEMQDLGIDIDKIETIKDLQSDESLKNKLKRVKEQGAQNSNLSEKANLVTAYKLSKLAIQKYIQTMETWKDGAVDPNAVSVAGNTTHTNVTKVTINEQHVYHSNLGYFLPDLNGNISNTPVPTEWLKE